MNLKHTHTPLMASVISFINSILFILNILKPSNQFQRKINANARLTIIHAFDF